MIAREVRRPSPTRSLVYIPIVHTMADMGALGPSVRRVKLAALGRQRLVRDAAVVEKLWVRIEETVANLIVSPGHTRVYQDGLPVCGHELEIVTELAGAGNRNQKLLLTLLARGAMLMGTESPEFLIEEYHLANTELAMGVAAADKVRQGRLHNTLLERRDRYIAERIGRTLGEGETGILFIGVLHVVDKYLAPDIEITYPLGRVLSRNA